MKWLILLSIVIVGCTQSEWEYKDKACRTDLSNCKLVDESNLRFFHDKCMELAKCMKAEGEIVHFNNQPHNPYACSIHKQGKTRKKGQYIYPRAELSFGRADSSNLNNEITICEIMTETGDQSDEYYNRMEETFKRMKERQIEEAKEKIERSKPIPPMKIREG